MGKCYAPIDICGAQFNALSCAEGEVGTVLTGATDAIVTCNLVDITRDPIIEQGRNDVSRNGAGARCAKRTTPDRIDGWEITMTLCDRIDTDLMVLLGLFEPVLDADGECVGIRPKCGDDEACNCATEESCEGVSMVIWHQNTNADGVDVDCPYVAFAVPKIVFTISSQTRSDTYNTYTVTGTAETNGNWGNGPGDVYPDPEGLGCEWAEWATPTPPPGGCTCAGCGFETAGESIGYTGAKGRAAAPKAKELVDA